MKIKTLLVALLGSLFLASCFEDDSSLNYKLMNPIVIDLGDEPTTYKVFAFDTLEISRLLTKKACRTQISRSNGPWKAIPLFLKSSIPP